MPAADAVAKLNRAGGKSSATPRKLRFQARMSNVFSPEKPSHQPDNEVQTPRRSSGVLRRRKSLQPNTQVKRRNSFSMPNSEGEEAEPPTNPKKKKTFLKNKEKANKASPLKKHGYNLQVEDNARVNLDDSPAKNTRSKNHNPLEMLAKANLPVPKRMPTKHKIKTPRGNSTASLAVKPARASPRKRKLSEAKEGDNPTEPDNRTLKRARHEESNNSEDAGDKDGNETSQVEEFFDAEQEQNAQDEPEGVVRTAHKSPKQQQQQRKRGRPPKVKESDAERQAKLKKVSDAQKASRKEAMQAIRDEYNSYRAVFAKNIESTIDIRDSSDIWMNMGAGAHMIRANVPNTNPKSKRGRQFWYATTEAIRAYSAIRDEHGNPSSEHENRIAEALVRLEKSYESLKLTDKTAESDVIIEDMFSYLVPKLVFLIKALVRGRHKRKFRHPETLDEFRRLLKLSLDVCNIALGWDPAPSTLESGIRKWTKNDIFANLNKLEKVFHHDMQRREWLEKDRLKRKELSEHQKAAREARIQKLEGLSAIQREQFYELIGMPGAFSNKHAILGEDVFDIDDIEDIPVVVGPGDTNVLRKEYEEDMAERLSQQSRAVREPTIDLPPLVPVDLSEEEKTALLNGLQRYAGQDRYKQILDNRQFGAVLQKRKVADLVNTARSFSQMMASKLGMEAYLADASLWWLRSADPDLEAGE